MIVAGAVGTFTTGLKSRALVRPTIASREHNQEPHHGLLGGCGEPPGS